MVTTESLEDYLEAIYIIKQKQGFVRNVDIKEKTEMAHSSISIAIKRLKDHGYITQNVSNRNSFIDLTDEGYDIAKRIYERHQFIAKLFMDLGVSEEKAFEDSCKVEHALSDETYEKIKEYYEKHIKIE